VCCCYSSPGNTYPNWAYCFTFGRVLVEADTFVEGKIILNVLWDVARVYGVEDVDEGVNIEVVIVIPLGRLCASKEYITEKVSGVGEGP